SPFQPCRGRGCQCRRWHGRGCCDDPAMAIGAVGGSLAAGCTGACHCRFPQGHAMRKAFVFILLCGLAACREAVAQNTDPVELNAETLGHFCQMNLLEHPGPKAQVHLKGLPGTPLFFSQVRDAIAYARMPEQSHPILAIHVNDMARPGASWDEPGQGNW